MSQPTGFRPQAKVRPYEWVDSKTQKRTPGIALLRRRTVLAHLTADEARALADKLHDLADKLDNSPQPLEPSPPAIVQELPTARPNVAYTSYSDLTAADGTEEPALPATIAE